MTEPAAHIEKPSRSEELITTIQRTLEATDQTNSTSVG